MTLTLTLRKASVAFRGFFYGQPSIPFLFFPSHRIKRLQMSLLFFCQRVTCLLPGLPAPLKRKHAFVPPLQKGLCHPGTCSLALSGTIEYQGLIFAVFVNPLFDFGWILSHGSWNFLAASPPVSIRAHIYDHRIRTAQQPFNLMNGNPGYVPGVACNRNRGLTENQ